MTRQATKTPFTTFGETKSPAPAAQFRNSTVSLEERIRNRAYLLAEAAGFPEGCADEFWFKAEKEVR